MFINQCLYSGLTSINSLEWYLKEKLDTDHSSRTKEAKK